MVPIREALFSGRKIEAIKLYREATGQGLVEAKAAVEKLEAELRSSAPQRFRTVKPGGCLGIALVLVVVGGGVVYFTLR